MLIKIATRKNITTLLRKMMIFGEKKEKELHGLNLIRKLKTLSTVTLM
tara:strand:+ start:315 stop:458 length:144 start_codon:yes stop_codon:yes gene_type:complete